MVDEASMEAIIARVQSKLHDINLFREYTVRFFETHPNLTQSPQTVHSVKSRLKDLQHLREKYNVSRPRKILSRQRTSSIG